MTGKVQESSIRAAEAASPPPSADRWAAALQRLDSKDRERYQLAVLDQTLEPSVIVKDVLAAAIAKKDECLKKRWKLVIGDRTVVVRDVLEKTAVWIEKFIVRMSTKIEACLADKHRKSAQLPFHMTQSRPHFHGLE